MQLGNNVFLMFAAYILRVSSECYVNFEIICNSGDVFTFANTYPECNIDVFVNVETM